MGNGESAMGKRQFGKDIKKAAIFIAAF